MGGIKILMGLGMVLKYKGKQTLPFSPIVYGKVSKSIGILVINRIMTKMGEYGSLNYSRILKRIRSKIFIF